MKKLIKLTQYALLLFLMVTTLFAKVTKIDIISFNDFHGNVAEDTREKGKNIGMAKMVGYVNEVKKGNPNVIVVSGGDNYQGTAISNLTFGAPVNRMMKAMKVTASAVGNHEFDWGSERIGKWAKEGNFDYLAANIYDKKTGKPVAWAKPYKIVKIDGVKVGIIGLATEQTKYQTKAEFVKNIEFKPANEAAQYWVNYLNAGKDKMGKPDIIIAITHIPSAQDENKVISGDELNKLTKVKGIAGIITGHSHRTVSGTMNGIPVIQAYKYGRALGRLHIVMEDGKIIEVKPSVDMVSNNKSDIIPDKGTEAALDKQTKELAGVLGVKVGKLNEDLTHDRGGSLTKLGYWATDAMRKATNAQIGLTNGGGLRRTLYKGDITMGDMYEIMPFDNQLVVVKVTGKQLRELIDHGIGADYMTDGQFAGLKVTYDPSKPYEHRITSIALENGTPINDKEIYTIATNDFIVGGGDRYNFKGAVEVKDLFIPIRDVLVDRIKEEKVVKVPNIDDVLKVDKEAEVKKAA
ncbi:2',3'-cyclic-nucleotide 2'-phosphodiesterase / 3'-nucleotidase [Cetobacterium ceti]|uniref:2',3'-cyclic-nucleotide 2'-phosphodiesterase / 3'-nucleotidase n=1 Tax=Cetobacterium ceti TaxID=180163 RepID=A0A1T4LA16_9FUSO|nr:5'-nucleotidase C-terminal domain-containing protein [Cetobacterium ceti]SJZ51443.1 2',3'-cyclic-nucleotide 2'-phosphodiesterase / 3'-nucleotidase [Cetobacterium ceti]